MLQRSFAVPHRQSSRSKARDRKGVGRALIDVALGNDAIFLERTFDVPIRALRKKLGAHANLIQTVRGIGYRFRDPADIVMAKSTDVGLSPDE